MGTRVRTFTLAAAALMLPAVLAGCGSGASSAPAVEPAITWYASPNPGSVNAYLVRTPDGIVLIDSSRNNAGGRAVVAGVRRTGLPLLAVLITHEHPDHIGGLPAIRAAYPRVPVYASEQTTALMHADPDGIYELARKSDADFPAKLVYPDHPFRPGRVLVFGGVRFETRGYGKGESGSATTYYLAATRSLFAGDVTADHVTPALIEGASCDWLVNIGALRRAYPRAKTAYPGHGAPSPAGAEEAQTRAYLLRFRGLVSAAVAQGSPGGTTVTAREQASILAAMNQQYPHYPRVASLPTLAQLNVAAVARELQAENPATLPSACRAALLTGPAARALSRDQAGEAAQLRARCPGAVTLMRHQPGKAPYDPIVSRTRRLAVVLLLNLGLVAALVAAGLAAHSLAVLAAGADYLADAGAIGVSLLAIRLAARPPAPSRPRGYPNATNIAALVNAGWLLALNISIAVAATWHLAAGTRRVEGLPVLIVSAVAAVIMLAGAVVLGGDAGDDDGGEDLNVKAVLLDTAADAAAAAGVAASGAIILGAGGLYWLDPATALAIAVIIGWHALKLIRKIVAALRSS